MVDKYEHIKTMYPGGNAVNFAVLAKQLGAARSAYMGIFGFDREAEHVIASLTGGEHRAHRVPAGYRRGRGRPRLRAGRQLGPRQEIYLTCPDAFRREERIFDKRGRPLAAPAYSVEKRALPRVSPQT